MGGTRRVYGESYIEGNAARNIQVVPDNTREQYQEQDRRSKVQSSRRSKKESGMSLLSLLVLTLAIGATLFVCIDYLIVQSNVTLMSKNIAKLESNIMELKNENDAAEESINASVSLAKIFKIATAELGMVYADKNQVITYKSNKSDYVRQFSSIPENENVGLLKQMIKK